MGILHSLDIEDRERLIVLQKKILNSSNVDEVASYYGEITNIIERAKAKETLPKESAKKRVSDLLSDTEKQQSHELINLIMNSSRVEEIEAARKENLELIKNALKRS